MPVHNREDGFRHDCLNVLFYLGRSRFLRWVTKHRHSWGWADGRYRLEANGLVAVIGKSVTGTEGCPSLNQHCLRTPSAGRRHTHICRAEHRRARLFRCELAVIYVLPLPAVGKLSTGRCYSGRFRCQSLYGPSRAGRQPKAVMVFHPLPVFIRGGQPLRLFPDRPTVCRRGHAPEGPPAHRR